MRKLIDEKGRIFGIINIIDLFIILAVVFVGGYVGLRYISPGVVSPIVNQQEIKLSFFAEMSPDFAVDNLEMGGLVEDDQRNVSFGRVIDFDVDRGIIHTQDAMGNQVMAEAENFSSLEIVSRATGVIIEDGGVRISGNVYTIGQTLTIRAGRSRFFVRLSGFEAVPQQ
ncbi:MAG: DUF4330 domain-containing protein [Defluviitaleaceae bacterium]|nr:DUF4330 domain-containing protein [Defluviitaleaceae bacterium]